MWFTCPQASTNRAQCRLTTLMEANALKVKLKVEHLLWCPFVGTAHHGEALRYMARTNQHRTYLPYIAGTHLPTMKEWRVE